MTQKVIVSIENFINTNRNCNFEDAEFIGQRNYFNDSLSTRGNVRLYTKRKYINRGHFLSEFTKNDLIVHNCVCYRIIDDFLLEAQ